MELEMIPLRVARERLGVSKAKMARLVRASLFPIYANPLDEREKLVCWSEVEEAVRRPRRITGPQAPPDERGG